MIKIRTVRKTELLCFKEVWGPACDEGTGILASFTQVLNETILVDWFSLFLNVANPLSF